MCTGVYGVCMRAWKVALIWRGVAFAVRLPSSQCDVQYLNCTIVYFQVEKKQQFGLGC